MFIGHYTGAFVAKSVEPKVPLWALFLGAQTVDVFWAIFVLAGIEKVRLVPGITGANPLDLYYMPYTHSLVATFVWAGAAFAAGRLLWGSTRSGAALALAVSSHWFLDLLVHRPDLALYDDTMKMGLGLWNFPLLSSALEIALFAASIAMCFAVVPPADRRPRRILALAALMIVFQLVNTFGPPPTAVPELVTTALVVYFLLAGLAGLTEAGSRRRAASGP